MSDWTIWGYKAHLVIEHDSGTFEVLNPVKEYTGQDVVLSGNKVLDAINEREPRFPPPPLTRSIKFCPEPSESWKNCTHCQPRTAQAVLGEEARRYYANV